MSRRVVITGIGPVTSAGVGTDEFFRNLFADGDHRPFQQLVKFEGEHVPRSKYYVPMPQFSLADHGLAPQGGSLMQPDDRMAVLAGKLALEDAGFAPAPEGQPTDARLRRAGVLIGTGLGGIQTALESYLCHCVPAELLRSVLPERRIVFNRMVVPRTMANSSAAWVSLCFGLAGACNTLSASCASGTYALGEAFRRIKDGYENVVLAGGVEWLEDPSAFIMRGFDILGVLTSSKDGFPGPFGKGRSGFLFAEGGACLLALEELEQALERGARVYAEIADFRASSDAYNIVQMDPSGAEVTRLLRGLAEGQKVDYLNAHGTGTVANDQIEGEAIEAVFGPPSRQPLINSTKGLLGHTLGASGAIEAAVTALSIAHGCVHRNIVPDPLEHLNLPLVTQQASIQSAISVSYGFGGHNGGLLFKRLTRA